MAGNNRQNELGNHKYRLLKLSFPNEIDNNVINKIVSNLKFKLLIEESVHLYFSGSEPVIKINTNEFF